MDLTLSYNGNTLPDTITKQLIGYAEQDLNVVPSYLITKLHFEGLWGGSAVAQADNNWGGMTWVNTWSDPHTRESGVVVTRGSARPANEGGYYIHYDTVQDFLKDWSYLIRRGGVYNVADQTTFDLAVKGMFIVGGATYDYATMNVEGSQQRYELYLDAMRARRSAINSANNNLLDTIDSGTDIEPDPDEPDDTAGGIDLAGFINDLNQLIKGMLIADIYHMGSSKYYKNDYLTLIKQMENTFKIKPTNNFFQAIKEKFTEFNSDYIPDDPTDPEPDPTDPDPTLVKIFPVKIKNGINFWKRSNWGTGTIQRNMTYGVRSGGATHYGYDIGGGGVNHNEYSITDGKVIKANFANGIGNRVIIKNDHDQYYIQYGHMKSFNVNAGDLIKAGDLIGIMGNTGGNYAIHLDVKISTTSTGFYASDTTINPEQYLEIDNDNSTKLPEP